MFNDTIKVKPQDVQDELNAVANTLRGLKEITIAIMNDVSTPEQSLGVIADIASYTAATIDAISDCLSSSKGGKDV